MRPKRQQTRTNGSSCFAIVDSKTGKPSMFYDSGRAHQSMLREAQARQQQFARRAIKLKEP